MPCVAVHNNDVSGFPQNEYFIGMGCGRVGHLVTRKGEGHTAYGSGNACIDRTVDSYLVNGTIPAKDPLC